MIRIAEDHMVVRKSFQRGYGIISIPKESLGGRDIQELISDVIAKGYDVVLGIHG